MKAKTSMFILATVSNLTVQKQSKVDLFILLVLIGALQENYNTVCQVKTVHLTLEQ